MVKTEAEVIEHQLQKRKLKPGKIKAGDTVKVKVVLDGIFPNPPKYLQEVTVKSVAGDLVDIEYLRNSELRVMTIQRKFLVKS
jgi:hypothetical protein